MEQLDGKQRAQVIGALVEGNSIRSVSRMTGIARNTISTQCDEIWSFCYAKDKNVPVEKRGEFGIGGVWTWTRRSTLPS